MVTYYRTACIFGRSFAQFIIIISNFLCCISTIVTATYICKVLSKSVYPCWSWSSKKIKIGQTYYRTIGSIVGLPILQHN